MFLMLVFLFYNLSLSMTNDREFFYPIEEIHDSIEMNFDTFFTLEVLQNE